MQIRSNVMTPPVSFGVGQKITPSFQIEGKDPSNSILGKVSTGTSRPGLAVIKDKPGWDRLWTAKALEGKTKPAVDFNKQAAIVSFLPESFGMGDMKFDPAKNQLNVGIKRLRFTFVATNDAPYAITVVDKKFVQKPPVVGN